MLLSLPEPSHCRLTPSAVTAQVAVLASAGLPHCGALNERQYLMVTLSPACITSLLKPVVLALRKVLTLVPACEETPEKLSAWQMALPAPSTLLEQLATRMARLDASYRPDKPFVKIKFHDFSQTTLEQAGARRDLDSYARLLSAAYARGNKAVRLLGVGVRLHDLRGQHEQLELFAP